MQVVMEGLVKSLVFDKTRLPTKKVYFSEKIYTLQRNWMKLKKSEYSRRNSVSIDKVKLF